MTKNTRRKSNRDARFAIRTITKKEVAKEVARFKPLDEPIHKLFEQMGLSTIEMALREMASYGLWGSSKTLTEVTLQVAATYVRDLFGKHSHMIPETMKYLDSLRNK